MAATASIFEYPRPNPHNELAHDLALHLATPAERSSLSGCLTWENIEFPDCQPYDRIRPDVFALRATLNPEKWAPTTYEVKAYRADLLADLRAHKWRQYFLFSAYVVFAFKEGLADPSEIPDDAGLILKGINGWRRVRRGRKFPEWRLTERQWMNLALKGRNPSPFEIFQRRRSGKPAP